MPSAGVIMAGIAGAAIIPIGVRFLAAPEAGARGYGVDATGQDRTYLQAKGLRDIASGLSVFALMKAGDRQALAAFLAAAAVIPAGDAVIVARNGGALATALGVHAATALFMLATAGLLARESRRA